MAPSFFKTTLVSLLLATANAVFVEKRQIVDYALDNTAALARRATLVSPPSPVAGWNYVSCWNDSTALRTLSGSSYSDTSAMTIESCINYCNNGKFAYAGMEYSSQCCKCRDITFVF
jgi:hypothetical protein